MPDTTTKPNLTRRRFLQWFAGLSLTAGAAVTYSRYLEPRWLSVEQIDLPLANLPPALDGKRIAQLSDIHLSEYFSPERLASALSEVADLTPDWLLLTGDFVGRDGEAAAGLVEPLRTLAMPVFAVYGNHDYWSDNAAVTRYLQAANVRVLLNEATEVESGLWVAGVDDLWSGHPDLAAAMRDVPASATTVLMAHEPDFFDSVLAAAAPVALQLSGHSHGGQVRFPSVTPEASGHYSYAPVLPQYGRRYPIGLRQLEGRFVYTNRGLGVWPLPIRWNCRPELTIFTLRSF